MAVSPIDVDRSTAGDRESFEDIDRELQDVVRSGSQWAPFGGASS